MRSVIAAAVVCMLAASGEAAPRPDISTNARKAERVVVAVVEDVSSRFAENEFGDRLIVSELWLRVEETLKGSPQNLVPMELEGGEVGDLRLTVSDLPTLHKGDRRLFFLDAVAGKNRPHGRGDGILKLDASDRVEGTSIGLPDLRATIKASQR